MARVLFVHAHPDDAEILAGGTLALLARSGHHVTIATMTPGDCGSDSLGASEIAAVRRRESADAAALIGANFVCAEFRDLAIFNDDESRRRVAELLRGVRPDLVITASPEDYHCDHEATSILVRDSCFGASAPNYETGGADPLPSIPHLYFADPIGGVDRFGNAVKPDFFVDMKAAFEAKRNMLACHASQRKWLKRQHHIDDYIDAMEQWTRARGKAAGVEFAEGFRRYRGHPYPQTPLLEELVGPSLVPILRPRSRSSTTTRRRA